MLPSCPPWRNLRKWHPSSSTSRSPRPRRTLCRIPVRLPVPNSTKPPAKKWKNRPNQTTRPKPQRRKMKLRPTPQRPRLLRLPPPTRQKLRFPRMSNDTDDLKPESTEPELVATPEIEATPDVAAAPEIEAAPEMADPIGDVSDGEGHAAADDDVDAQIDAADQDAPETIGQDVSDTETKPEPEEPESEEDEPEFTPKPKPP